MVWSESASPNDALNNTATRLFFSNLSRTANAAISLGSRVAPDTDQETNTSLLFLPDREMPLRYDKVQLVPFGEFIPFRSLFPAAISRSFGFFESDVMSGTVGSVQQFSIRNENVALGPFICYEAMYPHLCAQDDAGGRESVGHAEQRLVVPEPGGNGAASRSGRAPGYRESPCRRAFYYNRHHLLCGCFRSRDSPCAPQ
jgi:apolipoprotein N-acyltransferase